ncbi:tRNA adenosine(34) deaminase TadA [Pectinatus frisingensis]|jgi:tRNA(adenine34) deaminase|uniref:tRNA adenosine(34) deaminase TadA n=1 Tax=Pectinatus frisingensis TaxID=865 RepID=UPI001E47EF75|nr:tRNA adenosine(34) deaminase TadA [Pectinatus frisingensis]
MIGKPDAEMMLRALECARLAFSADEVPVGAVIADKKGNVVATGYNMQEHSRDATAHAEILVIRKACKVLGRRRLNDMTLYVTLEPCPMCAGAILLSNIGRLVYGAADSRLGAVDSLFALLTHPALNHDIEIRAGVREDECRSILQQFFVNKRSWTGK